MKFIPTKVTFMCARKLILLKKNSPNILFGAGITGIISSSVLACRATLKLESTLANMETDISDIKRFRNLESNDDSYSNYNKDLVYAYVKGSYSIVKLYAPSVLIGVTSIGMLTGSHITLTKRNTSLTAAYAGMAKSFDEYRKRVSDELGIDKELDIRHAISEETVQKDDNKKEVVKVSDPNGFSPYAKFFDEASINWQKNSELNRIFIQCQQNYANHLLHARGHIFLNEVYDMLGLDRTSAGQVVGWVVDQGGDNFIDFGMFEVTNSRFINGYERSILLDFNVDGVVYDKL